MILGAVMIVEDRGISLAEVRSCQQAGKSASIADQVGS